MAAPFKRNLDWWRHDVDLWDDVRFREAKKQFGPISLTIYVLLVDIALKGEGYYIPYESQKDKENCIWLIESKFVGVKYSPDEKTISEIIDVLVKSGLFADCHYPRVITSPFIQGTYYKATVERKGVVIDDSIWLLSMDEMSAESTRHSYYLKKLALINQPNNDDNRSDNEEKQPPNPQSTTDNSKAHDIREQSGAAEPPTLAEISAYCLNKKLAVDPRKFFDYFTSGNWVDSNGKPVRNWKQKLLTWNSHEGSIKKQSAQQGPVVKKSYTSEALNALSDNYTHDDL